MIAPRSTRASFGWAVALVATASVAWFQVFPLQNCIVIFAFAVVLPGGLAALVLQSKAARPRLMAVVAGAVAALIIDAVIAVVDGDSPLDVPAYGTVLGWKQVLTVALPVPAEFKYLAGPVLLTGIAVSVTVLAKGKPGRLLFAPAVVVWCAGVTLGVGGPLGFVALSAPLAIVTLARLVDLPAGFGRARGTKVALATGFALVAGLVGLVIAPAASGLARAEPFDPRSLFAPPITTDALPDPLDQLAAQLATPAGGTPALTLHTSEPLRTPFVTLTTYASYDGVTWRIPGTATPASGTQMPAVPGTSIITESVTGSALTAPWVAHTGEIVSVDTAGLLSFKDSGILIDSHEPPVNDYELAVTSVTDAASAKRPAKTTDEALLNAGCLPEYFRSGMAQAAQSQSDVTARIAASRTWLLTQAGLTPAPNAPTGQSCSRLEQLAEPGKDRRVSSAQAATLLTLGLRSQGIPARLAYGYRLGKQLPDGSYAPTAHDAVAFTQVQLDPIGWVAFDAAPSEAPADAPQSDSPELDRQSKQPLGDHKTNDPGAFVPPPSEPIPWLQIILFGLLAAVIVAGGGWLGYAASRRRRARREARAQQDVRAQTVAAWTEAIAALAQAGVPVAAATMSEVAREARTIPGATDAVWELGSLVEHALYDPRPMSADSGTSAFELADRVVTAVGAHRTRLDRLRGLIDARTPADIVRGL